LKVNIADFKNPDMIANLAELKKTEDINVGMRKHVADMAQLDEQIARLLQAIDDLGLADDTIVVFTSDNGPHGYGSAGIFRGAKHWLYDGGVHLPMLVRWPGHVQAGRVDGKSVLAGVDWLPTLSKIAGAKIDPSKFDGEDVSDIWLGKERPREKDLFWRTFAPKGQPVMLRGSWKMHQQRKGPPELYDLSSDPGERNNVADKNPAIVRDLSAALRRWADSLPKTYIGADTDKED
jgi:arylsulfatase A-like enzyme